MTICAFGDLLSPSRAVKPAAWVHFDVSTFTSRCEPRVVESEDDEDEISNTPNKVPASEGGTMPSIALGRVAGVKITMVDALLLEEVDFDTRASRDEGVGG